MKVEVFTTGCKHCGKVLDIAKRVAEWMKEVRVIERNLVFGKEEDLKRARESGVLTGPTIAIDGEVFTDIPKEKALEEAIEVRLTQ